MSETNEMMCAFSCPANTFKKEKEKMCALNCDASNGNYYYAKDSTCMPCPNGCKVCNSDKNCSECTDTKYGLNANGEVDGNETYLCKIKCVVNSTETSIFKGCIKCDPANAFQCKDCDSSFNRLDGGCSSCKDN
jgi:hypothetical protein